METLIVEVPPRKSIVYRVAGTETNPNPLKNERHAAAILAALQAVQAEKPGFEDPEALLMYDFYDKGVVFRPYHLALRGLCDAIDPVDKLGSALYDQNPSEEMNDLEQAFSGARYGINLDDPSQIGFTSHEGLLGFPAEDGSLKVEPFNISEYGIDIDEGTLAIAERQNLTHFTYQYELLWTTDRDNHPFPLLLSDECRIALGVLGTDGQFRHVQAA